jgi:CRP-like cAMP-binding protein
LERTKTSRPKKTKPAVPRPGTRTDSADPPVENQLLRSLSDREYAVIEPHLEPIDLPQHLILQEPGADLDFAYFPDSGLASLVVLTTDGRSVEVATVGKEGVIGASLAMGMQHAPHRAIVQVPGTALRLPSEVLGQILSEAPGFQRLLTRYVMVRGMEVAQIAACNRLHAIEQRLARWLLICQDRVGSQSLPVTHELLAQMLGTGRPSVSLAAGTLQREGLIENLRGSLKIVNRKGLENSACECYRAIHNCKASLAEDFR